METCFVIQPFDNDVFDERFHQTYKPGIEAANLAAYRIDKDPSSRNLISEIEERIRKAKICFADITQDNPNVWYELGYAFACGKDVVMVCENIRTKFPFDVSNKSIISYKTGSAGHFVTLQNEITQKLEAYLKKESVIDNFISNPIKAEYGISQHAATMMVLLLGNQSTEDDFVAHSTLTDDMQKALYTTQGINLAFRELKRGGFIETEYHHYDTGYNEQPYLVCKLTNKGEEWVMQNQDRVQLKKANPRSQTPEDDNLDFYPPI